MSYEDRQRSPQGGQGTPTKANAKYFEMPVHEMAPPAPEGQGAKYHNNPQAPEGQGAKYHNNHAYEERGAELSLGQLKEYHNSTW